MIRRAVFLLVAYFLAVFLCVPAAEAAFGIDLNFYSIDFGDLDMGTVKDDVPSQGLVATCTTDQGNAWYLMIRNEQPLQNVNNPAAVIPDTNFYWYGVAPVITDVTGNNSLVTSYQDFTYEKTAYTGQAGEGAAGTQITLKFKVDVPNPAQSGEYHSRVVLTFTE